jgi:hypothetical protein
MAVKKTRGGKKVNTYTKRWTEVQDSHVRHVWAWPDGTNEITVDPTFYADSGIPVCPDGGEFNGDDMIYVRTEILS